GDDRARRHPRRLARHHDRAPPLARARRGRDRTAPLHGAQQPLLEPGLAPADGVAPRHDLHLRHRALRGLAPPGLGRGPRAPGSRARDQRPRPLPPAQRSGAERLVLDPALTRAHPTAAAADGPLKIAVRDLVVLYGGTRALDAVSLDIPAHRVTALIGPSGCGKSTFLRCLNRMNDHIPGARVGGQVTIDGDPIYGPEVDPVALRRRIGMVFQKSNPFPKSVFDNVAFGPRVHGERDPVRLSEITERTLRQAALWDEVKDRLDRSALELSGGQQQRALIQREEALARATIERDHTVSRFDVEIDDLSLKLLALRQPAARDLRLITTALKITTDLERIGDMATHIAERAIELAGE